MMRIDLQERLEFLADELAREEAVVLVVASAHLAMEMDTWSKPVRLRFVERAEAPGLYDLEAKPVEDPRGPDS